MRSLGGPPLHCSMRSGSSPAHSIASLQLAREQRLHNRDARMLEPTYTIRAGLWSFETVYQLDFESLVWRNARHDGRVSFSAIHKVQVYKVRFIGSRKTYWRCVLHYDRGRKLRLQAAHHLGFRQIEDRTTSYIPF